MAVKFRDYYEVLGIARGASEDEIRKAYRKLARKDLLMNTFIGGGAGRQGRPAAINGFVMVIHLSRGKEGLIWQR